MIWTLFFAEDERGNSSIFWYTHEIVKMFCFHTRLIVYQYDLCLIYIFHFKTIFYRVYTIILRIRLFKRNKKWEINEFMYMSKTLKERKLLFLQFESLFFHSSEIQKQRCFEGKILYTLLPLMFSYQERSLDQ